MKRVLPCLTAVAALTLPVPAEAKPTKWRPDCEEQLIRSANHHRTVVVKRHGKRAPGRNIVRWGIERKSRTSIATCRAVRRYRNTLVRMRTTPKPAPVVAGATYSASAAQAPTQTYTEPTATSSSAGGPEAFAQCESGGSWTAQNPSGAYGRYQIMPLHYGSGGLCAGMGKSPGEQTECANRIYETQGSSAWSQCGG
jgi:hypothetical protein